MNMKNVDWATCILSMWEQTRARCKEEMQLNDDMGNQATYCTHTKHIVQHRLFGWALMNFMINLLYKCIEVVNIHQMLFPINHIQQKKSTTNLDRWKILPFNHFTMQDLKTLKFQINIAEYRKTIPWIFKNFLHRLIHLYLSLISPFLMHLILSYWMNRFHKQQIHRYMMNRNESQYVSFIALVSTVI